VKQGEIVNVPDIRRLQHFGDEMVESIKIEVCCELTGEVADRKTTPAGVGLEEVVAGKLQVDRLLGV
jgi:hypothetical protein